MDKQFSEFLEKTAKEVSRWPAWKQTVLRPYQAERGTQMGCCKTNDVWPIDPYELMRTLDQMLHDAEVIRIQQVRADDGEQAGDYTKIAADQAWQSLNEQHKELTNVIRDKLNYHA